jgi:hypothetical protein
MESKQQYSIFLGFVVPFLTFRMGLTLFESAAWLGLGVLLGAWAALVAFRSRGERIGDGRERSTTRADRVVVSSSGHGLKRLRAHRLLRERRRCERRCHYDRFYLALLRDL